MSALPAGVAAALIENGGCKCTPEPWKGCDGCGRPVAPWTRQMGLQVAAIGWTATTIDGVSFEKKNILSLENIPAADRDKLAELHVVTDSPHYPMVHVVADPRKARINLFARHHIRVGVADNKPKGGNLTVQVFELQLDRGSHAASVYLYLHPERGLILSTEQLGF